MPEHLPFTVLCVDDVADVRLSLSLLLAPEGYRVAEAATGAEALALAPGKPAKDFISNYIKTLEGV